MNRDEQTAGKSLDEVDNVGHSEEDEFPTTLSLENSKQKPARKRKVSFPEDASIISKSVEPVNPWADVSNIPSSEVITAYISACGRFRVKPIDKLIKQLKEYDVFHGRIDILDLKGVKLDLKSCEAIEEVLKKVQVYTFDLENTNLEDEGAIAFAEMIEFYHSAVQIHIGYNPRIKTRGWQMFSQMLKKTTFVDHIDLRHCCFNDSSITLMARSLKLNTSLRVLHLEGDNLSGKLLLILCAGLKLNTTLSELFLGDNFLVPSDASTLAAMLKSNFTLHLLDVRNNMLQDQGLLQLCDGLKHQNAKGAGVGVRMLVLWNNQITRNGMVPLANLLALTQNIQTLNIGHNRLGNDGIRNLQIGLLKNRSLLRLGVLNTKITAEGAVALAEYIADTRSLLRVDLRENDLFVGGLMALTLAVKINQTVVRIDLDKDLKKEQGMEETQTALLVEIYQHLEGNKKLAIRREETRRLEMQQRLEEEARKAEERLRNQQCDATDGVCEPADDVFSSRFTVSKVRPDSTTPSTGDNPAQSTGDEPNSLLVDTTSNNHVPQIGSPPLDALMNSHLDNVDLSARGVHVRNNFDFYGNDVQGSVHNSDDAENSRSRGVHVELNTDDTTVAKYGDSRQRDVHMVHKSSGSDEKLFTDYDNVECEDLSSRDSHVEKKTNCSEKNNLTNHDNNIVDDLSSHGVHVQNRSDFQEREGNVITPDLSSSDVHVDTNTGPTEDRESVPLGGTDFSSTSDISRVEFSHDSSKPESGGVFVLDADVGDDELPSNASSDGDIPREQKGELRDSLLNDEDTLSTEMDELLLEDSDSRNVMYNGEVETPNAPSSLVKDVKKPVISEDLNPEDFDKEMDELLAGVKIDLTELPSPQDEDDFWNKDMQEILQSSTKS